MRKAKKSFTHVVHVSDCFDSDKQNIVHLVAYILICLLIHLSKARVSNMPGGCPGVC